MITKQATLRVGGYSNQIQAGHDAADFGRASAFANRSAYFPNPLNHRVTIKVASAEVHSWPEAPSPLNQFYIELKLELAAETEARIDGWVKRAEKGLRVFQPAAYSDQAVAAPKSAPVEAPPSKGTFPSGKKNEDNFKKSPPKEANVTVREHLPVTEPESEETGDAVLE